MPHDMTYGKHANIIFTNLHRLVVIVLSVVFIKLSCRGTGFESRPGRIFVIGVVHIQCFKLFKELGCAVLSMVL